MAISTLAVNGHIPMDEPGYYAADEWVIAPFPKERPEVQEPFSTVIKYNHYTFYNVHALFRILDDLEANRDTYYNALCESKNGRHVMKNHQGIVDINTGETAIDLLRWYAYLEDWPFYIERLKTQFYKNKGGSTSTGKGPKRGHRVVNRIVLNTRPLSWFGVVINNPARCFHRSMSNARAKYKELKLHEGDIGARLHSLRVSFNTGSYVWQDKSAATMDIVSIVLNIGDSTVCQSPAILSYSAGEISPLPSTTT